MKVLAVVLFALVAIANAEPKPAPGLLGAGLIAPGLVAPAGVLGVPGILGGGLIAAPGVLGLGLGVVPRVVAVPPLGTLAAPQPAAILGHGKIIIG